MITNYGDSGESSGSFLSNSALFPRMRSLGQSMYVPVIDLTAKSKALVESLGPTASQPIYLTRENGDNTHFSMYGAGQMSNLVAQCVRELNLPLTTYLR